MFGYVTINRPELKVKDCDIYQGYYCGLCEQLRKKHGLSAGLTLSYDMTFLGLLLSSLYEQKERRVHKRCPVHCTKQQMVIHTEALGYAADMNILLAYHNLLDDWRDDHSVKSLTLAIELRRRYAKVEKEYPRQNQAVLKYMKRLKACEKRQVKNMDYAAGLTGAMLAEIYVWKDDYWKDTLYQIGFYLGKFVYLMDAYEDVYTDKEKKSYNPFITIAEEADFEERSVKYLNLMMAECSRAFELLPILKNQELLRNIIYSGVWVGYEKVQHERTKQEKEKKNG